MFPWTRRRQDAERCEVALTLWRELHEMLVPVLLDVDAARGLGAAIRELIAVTMPEGRSDRRLSNAKRLLAAHIQGAPKASSAEAANLSRAYGVVTLWLESQTLGGASAQMVYEETAAIINAALHKVPAP
jgi:hypothetical protein